MLVCVSVRVVPYNKAAKKFYNNNMDKETQDLLNAWNLGDYVNIFKENDVDIDCLALLSDDMMKELVPQVGPRARLKSNIEQWKSLLPGFKPTTPYTTDIAQAPPKLINVYSEKDQIDSAPIVLENIGADNFVFNLEGPLPIEQQPTIKVHTDTDEELNSISASDPQLELLQVLESSNQGRSLLKSFKGSGVLDSLGRRRLCNLLINHEINDDPHKRVPANRLLDLAYQITKVFPKEHPTTYFIPYLSLGHGLKRAAKGKLLDCLNNRRREYRKSGLISSNRRSSSSSSGPSSPQPLGILSTPEEVDEYVAQTLEQILTWLRNSSDPWQLVENNWAQTARLRLKQVMSTEGPTIDVYMNEYPALKKPTGYLLLHKDFEVMYPGCGDNLYQYLPIYKHKILQLTEERVTTVKDLGLKTVVQEFVQHGHGVEEESNAAALLCLSFLAGTASTRSKRSKVQWRPSQLEVRDGFMTRVESEAEVQETVTRRREKLHSFGLTLQPFIIIVGPSLSELTHYFVVIDNIFYKLNSILEAVDTCFKVIIALNAKYPVETAAIWYFVQRGFYKIKPPWDKGYTSVNALLSDVGVPSL